LTAPGGWGAKFREVAGERIEPTPLGEEIEDINIIEKSSMEALEQRRETLTPGRALAMTLQLGRRGYYNDRVIGDYTRTLLTFDPNLTVLFVDADGRFVASSNGASVMAAMQGGEQGQRLVDAIERADLLEIKRLVGHTTSAAKPGLTNAEALDIMRKDGVESLIAVDDSGRPVGIVRRDDIVARLLVKLASG
jgi:CBS-domain-containing membrane protein